MMRQCTCFSTAFFVIGLVAMSAIAMSTIAVASIEEVKLPSGYIATADYRTGKESLPAILMLHGFLSTRNFLTVSNLVESLANEGYSVLAPNLSLGVNNRKVSLACEAIHTHSLENDIAEIDYWVEWLIKHGHSSIVIMGHSYGSLHGLIYALKYHNPAVKKLIAASLVDADHEIGFEKSKAQIRAAKVMLTEHDNNLKDYHVSYCKKYVAPPEAFLSYAIWSREKILAVLAKVQTPVEVILGSADKRMGPGWPQLLKDNGVKVTIIEGANHFFHNEQEFDLLDVTLKILRNGQ